MSRGMMVVGQFLCRITCAASVLLGLIARTATAADGDVLLAREHLTIKTERVSDVRFSPDSRTLLVLAGTTLRIWSLAGETPTLQRKIEDVSAVAVAPDNRTLAIGQLKAAKKMSIIVAFPVLHGKEYSGRVSLFEMATGAELAVLNDWKNGVTSALTFSADGKDLASSHFYSEQDFHLIGFIPVPIMHSERRYLEIWDVGQRTRRAQLEGPKGLIGALTYAANGSTLAAGSRSDRQVHLWEAASLRTRPAVESMPPREPGFHQGVQALAFSPDSNLLALAANSWESRSPQKGVAPVEPKRAGQVVLHDLSGKQPRATLGSHADLITALAFSADGTCLASAAQDMRVKLWDLAAGKEALTLAGHTAAVTSVAFSADGKWLATGSLDQTVMLWSVRKAAWAEAAKLQAWFERKAAAIQQQLEQERQAKQRAEAAEKERSAATPLKWAKEHADKGDAKSIKSARFWCENILKDYPETEAAKNARQLLANLKVDPAKNEAAAAAELKKARDRARKGDPSSIKNAAKMYEAIGRDFPDTNAAKQAKELLDRLK